MLYQFLVYHQPSKTMLFDISGESLTLPSFTRKEFHAAETTPIHTFFYDEYGLNTNVLQRIKTEDSRIVYEVEVLDREPLHHHAETSWTSPFSKNALLQLEKSEAEVLKKWKAELKKKTFPWSEYGFRSEIESWAKTVLNDPDAFFQQIRSWKKGVLLKVTSSQQNAYMKVVPPVFKHEPLVQKYMDRYGPEVLAVDSSKHAYVMREMRGELLGNSQAVEFWEEAARRLAQLQRAFSEDEGRHRPSIPDRSLDEVISAPMLITTVQAVQNWIAPKEVIKLLANVPAVVSLLSLLKTKQLQSIDHGDFFGGNVIIENDEPFLYDWSNSCLTHPFLSLVHFLEEVEAEFLKSDSEDVLHEYLQHWTHVEGFEVLQDDFAIMKLLQPIFYLVVHVQFIMPELGQTAEDEDIIDHYLTEWSSNVYEIDQRLKG
ncbi:phosphotransferase [Geomicrobium sp. JSM 1781026]|uniref:phosphotransferase n=1 Tax=Geomicrobium sp. JSM 1781026 TaxID=3344580 RepID=UPI0035C21A3B